MIFRHTYSFHPLFITFRCASFIKTIKNKISVVIGTNGLSVFTTELYKVSSDKLKIKIFKNEQSRDN